MAPPPRRLRAWLLAQAQSGRFPGLVWDDPERSALRIPWQRGGSALCKAWAEFKGRLPPGAPPDPSGWKSRLRCALHKSPEFQELPHRSQPHGQNPYRVYRVLPPRPTGGTAGKKQPRPREPPPLIGSSGSPAPEEEEEEDEEDGGGAAAAEPEGVGGASPGPAPAAAEAPPLHLTLTLSCPHPLPPAEGPHCLLVRILSQGAPCCSLRLPPGDFLLEPNSHPHSHWEYPDPSPSHSPPRYQHLLPRLLLTPMEPHSSMGQILMGLGLLLASSPRGLFLRLRARPPRQQGAPWLRLRSAHAAALPPGDLVLAFDAERFRREVREHREGAPRPEPSVSLELGESPGTGICIQAEALLSPAFMAAILSPGPMGDLAAILEQEKEEEQQHKMAAGMEVATADKMAAPIGYGGEAKMASAREVPAKMAAPMEVGPPAKMAAMGGASKMATRSGEGSAQKTAVTWCTRAPKMAAAMAGGGTGKMAAPMEKPAGKMAAMGFPWAPPLKMAASMSNEDLSKMATATKMAAPME